MKILNYFCAFGFAVLLAAGCSNQKPADSSPIITPVVTNQTPDNKETSSVAPGFANPAQLTEKAPETFKAQFDTTKGKFTIEVTRSLAPNGADRFYNLVRSGYFTDIAFFRVIPGFMCQFGIHGDPNVAAKWREANITDDPVKGSNTRGSVTFATAGPGTRTTQLFINFGYNVNLDGMGFSPFGKVSDGMDVVDKINGEYGENPPEVQGRLQNEGNAYLKKVFPNLDYIKSATIIPADGAK
jgi:peptidyl-prolyl cis-trans isomerase A (cyclophilin A)